MIDTASVKLIKKVMIDYEITQVEVASALSISPSTVSKVLSGVGVSSRVLNYICERVGVSTVDELYKKYERTA